jgi:hypothetical protein
VCTRSGGGCLTVFAYRDKKVVSVFVRFIAPPAYPLQRFRSQDNDRTRSGQGGARQYGAYSTAF